MFLFLSDSYTEESKSNKNTLLSYMFLFIIFLSQYQNISTVNSAIPKKKLNPVSKSLLRWSLSHISWAL